MDPSGGMRRSTGGGGSATPPSPAPPRSPFAASPPLTRPSPARALRGPASRDWGTGAGAGGAPVLQAGVPAGRPVRPLPRVVDGPGGPPLAVGVLPPLHLHGRGPPRGVPPERPPHQGRGQGGARRDRPPAPVRTAARAGA